MAAQKVGENVLVEVDKGKIVITIDLNHRGELSASGKTIRVASTLGNKQVTSGPEKVFLGLNAYVYAE